MNKFWLATASALVILVLFFSGNAWREQQLLSGTASRLSAASGLGPQKRSESKLRLLPEMREALVSSRYQSSTSSESSSAAGVGDSSLTQAYSGSPIRRGEPADPGDDSVAFPTYAGPQIVRGAPSDPNDASDGVLDFSLRPINLGVFEEPSAGDSITINRFPDPIRRGEYADPGNYDYGDVKEIRIGEPSDPNDS